MALRPDTEVQYLKGVGPKLGDLFRRRGIKTVQDIFEIYPRAYEDQRAARNIASLKPNDIVSLKAQVVKVQSLNLGRSKRKMYDVTLKDASGLIHCKYFRVPFRATQSTQRNSGRWKSFGLPRAFRISPSRLARSGARRRNPRRFDSNLHGNGRYQHLPDLKIDSLGL